jgi:drug/metabolite transporter (DMT)-like permease
MITRPESGASSGDHAQAELVWVRNAFQVGLAVIIFAPTLGRHLFRTKALGLQLVRSAALLGSTTFYFLALRYLPLAETAAIAFAAPLFTVVLAGPVLGERVTRASMVAALVGFLGVLAVIQPFAGAVQPAIVLPLATAVTSSAYTLLTRKVSDRDPPQTTWFFSGTVGVVVSSVVLAQSGLAPVGGAQLVALLLVGVFGSCGHLLLIAAYARAPASALAPLAYLELVWVTIAGLLVFDDLPNVLVLLGIATIAIAGIAAARSDRSARSTTTLDAEAEAIGLL